MNKPKLVNPYDLNAISEVIYLKRKRHPQNPRDENPYSLTIERSLRGICIGSNEQENDESV